MKRRGNWTIMTRLITLVGPLLPVMLLAIALGVAGFLCATFLTIFGRLGAAEGGGTGRSHDAGGRCLPAWGCLPWPGASCDTGNRPATISSPSKLLALIRDKVFQALRRLCPAKLEGRDKGDLIAVITSDIELLEVFTQHTISPGGHRPVQVGDHGAVHWELTSAAGWLAAAAYAVGGRRPAGVDLPAQRRRGSPLPGTGRRAERLRAGQPAGASGSASVSPGH